MNRLIRFVSIPALLLALAACNADDSVTLSTPTPVPVTSSPSPASTAAPATADRTATGGTTAPASGSTSATTGTARYEEFSGDGGFVISGNQVTLVYANGVQASIDIGQPVPTTLPATVDAIRGQLSLSAERIRWIGVGDQAYWERGGSGSLTDANGGTTIGKDGKTFCYTDGQARWVDQDGSAQLATGSGLLTVDAEGHATVSGNVEHPDDLVGRYTPCNFRATIMVELSGDVLFDFDKDTLTPRGRQVLASVAPTLSAQAVGHPVTVTGHTDAKGEDSYNEDLGLRRARSVVTELQRLVPGLELTPATEGEGEPVAANSKPDGSDNPAGRAKNRRVTIVWAAPRQ